MSKRKIKFHFPKIPTLPIILTIILFTLTIVTYQVVMRDKYYPLTFIGDTNVSFLSKGQAVRKFQSSFDERSKEKLQFAYAQGSFEVDISTSSASLDYSSFDKAFNNGRAGSFFNNLTQQLQALISTFKISPSINFSLDNQLDPIGKAVEQPYTNAQLIYNEITTPEGSPSANIQIKEGSDGIGLDKDRLTEIISQFLLTGRFANLLPIKTVPPKVTTEHVKLAKLTLEKTIEEPINLNFEDSSWTIDAKQLLTLFDLTEGTSLLDKEKTNSYIENIAGAINQEVQEGLFEFNPISKRVSSFKPSQVGRKLDEEKTFQLVTQSLSSNSKNIDLPVEVVNPKIQTSDVNSLGINELIGQGISHFRGSIPNRIYNIGLTASKINGVLIPPGEIFSFNRTVGDITEATGFKKAYVIKEGRTVLDDGGGVCQDSTTLFRAVLNAGLPVIKRTAHAYRVGYYEQGFPPGLDATVYYPSVDFQFKNDTGSHILIQAYTAGTTLYVDLYGTSDGRIASLSKPVVTNITPAPPELRQDDPTLPKGVVKQVDWAASGAKVSFNRTVTRNGEIIAKETWNSSYKPWQAVYLIGTQ
ncbi:hypothetical protein A3C59_01625 [Candidatus Daviesbacteria bacterium RIFCSPHIGHO2_02_FULL_36_13]|uniref:Peptidoglycan binding domain-containing protein n=1 Tax=Candidatus Daviesbacteria bacterium RIFCSPHIGHO2_02_FULL_36_13 TaxID=1797768 RepID=A0A1F5JT27_9BACT|nr:MAG: hypothetical protein A3C59_01625 [Candidatus Daviesbacteria bacterium RIFCSPHIGHO2_02_FULL_36_13]